MARIIDEDTGIEVNIGRNEPEFGSQPFVTISTENTPQEDCYGPELGLPKINVLLNDATLYDKDGKDYAEKCEREKIRYKRAQDICAGYECEMDNSVRGANRYGRYAVVTEDVVRGNGYSVTRCNRESISDVATEDMLNGHQPVCYFDLDVLAGDEPLLMEDDVVQYEGERYRVERVDEDLIEGEVARYLCLVKPDTTIGNWDDWLHRVLDSDVELVKRAEEDDRMPVRYGIARIVTMAVFNTIPSP